MARTFAIRFNDEEEARLLRVLAASGDPKMGVGTHIKRVYFESMALNTEVMHNIEDELRTIHWNINEMSKKLRDYPDVLPINVLMGALYKAHYARLNPMEKIEFNQYISVNAINDYLKRYAEDNREDQ